MPFITQGKANIKYLLIVVLVAAVAIGIIITSMNSFRNEIISLNKVVEIKKPEKILEREISNEKAILENYCISKSPELKKIDLPSFPKEEYLKLARYYSFNLKKNKDGLVVICKDADDSNVLLSILENNTSLVEIFKYINTDLSHYVRDVFGVSENQFSPFLIDSAFERIEIKDINNDNKDEIFFYSENCGGSNAGCTFMIHKLNLENREVYYIYRYINGGPDEKPQVKNFYSKNLGLTENKTYKDYLINLMDEWFVSVYGDKNG